MKRFTPYQTLKYAAIATGLVVLIVVVYALAVVNDDTMPTLAQLEHPKQDLATQVFSADGVLLEHFATTRRTYIPFDSIPKNFVNALIATEDRTFYSHWGVHSMRIVKAAFKNVFAFRAKEGASTITQQLARNLYFTQEQTLSRKIREAWTAVQIERTYTKHEILELYANTVYYGRGAYGIQVASQVYFNKQAINLSAAECAYLVGLFKAPEKYNSNDSAGISRRNLILTMMTDEGYLTGDQWAAATAEPLAHPTPASISRGIAPHFVEVIRQQLSRGNVANGKLQDHDLYRDGLIIHTTLNSGIQRAANDAVAEHLATYQQLFERNWSWKGRWQLINQLLDRAVRATPAYIAARGAERTRVAERLKKNRAFVDSVKRDATTIEAAVVVMDPRTGAILAMVGASPQSMKLNPTARYSFNHATQARRQPGSSFKPFVYASAFEDGLTPDTEIESGPFTYQLSSGEIWSPSGASKTGGPMALRAALKFSVNTVAARLITEHTSPSKVVALCQRLGIQSPLHPVPSIALGAVEVTPLEMTDAYGAFVNHGVSVPPSYITRIEDRMGNVLYEARLPTTVTDAMNPNVARNMISIMRGVVDGGTASSIRKFYRGDAAGKTGTTNDFADAWFVGYTPQLVAGVWVGFDDRRVQFTGDYGQGGRAAAPIWGRLMSKVYSNLALGYSSIHFDMKADSADTVGVDVMVNPPTEVPPDKPPVEIEPERSPADLPKPKKDE